MADKDNSVELIGEPLDTLQMKMNSVNCVNVTVPAINVHFKENRCYVPFLPVPANTDPSHMTPEEEEWGESSSFLVADLQWLLRLPYHKFWSQVIHDIPLHKCLESYLSDGPRSYDLDYMSIKDDLRKILRRIHKLVFLVFLRMSTCKEDKRHHMRKEAFGQLIYDNYVFDVPKIMDLCALYSSGNFALLSRMVQNIFEAQPKYFLDLKDTSDCIMTALNNIEERLPPLPLGSQSDKLQESLPVETLQDLVNYICDISVTLDAFTDVYLAASEVFNRTGLTTRIATFYEQVFPMFEKCISQHGTNVKNEKKLDEIKRKCILSKTCLVKTFRNILNFCCIQHIYFSKSEMGDNDLKESKHFEIFLDTFSEIVSEKHFLKEYNTIYPLETDFELFTDLGIKFDLDRLSYLFSSIHDSDSMAGYIYEKFSSALDRGGATGGSKHSAYAEQALSSENGLAENGVDFECEDAWDETLLNSIRNVRECFPMFGEGFIEKCLEHFDFNQEKTLDALLNNTLPDELENLDKNMIRKPRHVQNASVLSERRNVFDNDEFDVFNRRDVNVNNIHIGKKERTPLFYQNLKEDRDANLLKQLTLACEMEDADHTYREFDVYEDEYDDTYDSNMIGVKEPPLEDVPDDKGAPEAAATEEASSAAANERVPRPDDFCTNPEILRQRAAERYESRNAARNNRRGPPSVASSSSESSRGRQQKDRHKSNVANHNRRKQSDFKRSRGMGPI